MPSFVVEDGSGTNPGANSYASEADFDAYNAAHLYPSTTTGSQQKQTALMMATRLIDQVVEFDGYQATTTQALQWPRQAVENNDVYYTSYALAGYYSPFVAGAYFPSNVIPVRLKQAAIEFARQLLVKDLTKDYQAKGIRGIGLGQGALSVEFDTTIGADLPGMIPDLVKLILQPFGRLRGASAGARVRRG